MTTAKKQKSAKTSPASAPPVPRSRRELQALAAEVAALKLDEVRLTAELDARLRLAREQCEPQLNAVREAIAARTAAVRAWAEAHPEVFSERRTLELPEAWLGWRAAPPSLKPLAGWTWERVTARLKDSPDLRPYVRVREEPNKIRLLADRVALGAEVLASAGLQVVQEELFFIEPRLEATGVPAREKQAA